MNWFKTIRNLAGIIIGVTVVSHSCAIHRYAPNVDYPRDYTSYEKQGEIKELFCPSSGDDLIQRRALVYLPEEYSDSLESRYPVLYLLHGARGNELSWITLGRLLENVDSLTSCGAMPPTIVVLPNTNSYKSEKDFGKSRCKNAMQSFFGVDGSVEKFFVQDVVKCVDKEFRTIADKEHRAIAGMSLGALQSIHISATHPDYFDYIGLFSPMVHSPMREGQDNDFFEDLKQKQKVQFASAPKLYWIMIGTSDIFYMRMKAYDRQLSRKGYPHQFLVTSGGHQWYNWEDYAVYFMEKLWDD